MAAPQAFFRLDLQDRIDKYRDKSVLRSQPAQLSLDAWSQSYDLMDGLEVSGSILPLKGYLNIYLYIG